MYGSDTQDQKRIQQSGANKDIQLISLQFAGIAFQYLGRYIDPSIDNLEIFLRLLYFNKFKYSYWER